MKASSQKPRSTLSALILFGGWLDILFGAFLALLGGKDGLTIGLNALATGTILVGVIYYRERSRKAELPYHCKGLTGRIVSDFNAARCPAGR